MTTLFKRTVLPAIALASGLAQAQVPWHLPGTVYFPGYCDVLTNVTYAGPAQWGWYTGTYDATACFGATATGPFSGAEAKRLLGLNGPGAALTMDASAIDGQAYVLILNSDQTFAIWDLAGTQINTGSWALTPQQIRPASASVLSPRLAR